MIEILGSVKPLYSFDILLECRKKDEEFKVYQPGGKKKDFNIRNPFIFGGEKNSL